MGHHRLSLAYRTLKFPIGFAHFYLSRPRIFQTDKLIALKGEDNIQYNHVLVGGYGKNLLARSIIGPSLSYIHRASMAIGCQAAKL